jgi:hypothetical protein
MKIIPFLLFFSLTALQAQQSIARRWSELTLLGLREDFARPPVNARTLFHVSMAMYDAWAAYDSIAKPYILGNTINGVNFPFTGVPAPADIEAARKEAICYAAFRVLNRRFQFSPKAYLSQYRFALLMSEMGYDINELSTDYTSGKPAALGNKIAEYIIQLGLNDNSNETSLFAIQNYTTVNGPLDISLPGNPSLTDPNHWQPLKVEGAVDQNGNPIPSLQKFQMPEWGRVVPFAMDNGDKTSYFRGNWEYPVYHDPGPPPIFNTTNPDDSATLAYKWGNAMVAAWGSHHDTKDGVLWDISPASIGNVQDYPKSLADYSTFYDFEGGGDNGIGHAINPKTGQPYTPNLVPRGDYTRVISQFWADGPNSETPPGHWYSILNYAMDQPGFVRKFNGKGSELGKLEWDVKIYFTLGGALHDAAICAWGIKGWYDASRPVSVLRYMASKGQSSVPALPSYHPEGLELIPGFVELVQAGDPLAGANNENIGKVKLYTWKGHAAVPGPTVAASGAAWILGESFITYQKKTFVTPPFAGFISGHSTFSRAAADVITGVTGDPFFPGGMGVFPIAANNGFLAFEEGPSVPVNLQWATYRDAADQTSLSRIWGGIHAPFDDIPGRTIGSQCAIDAFVLARDYFYNDNDGDGYFTYEDCDDYNAAIFPGATETLDNIDNNCDGLIDNPTGVLTVEAPKLALSPNPAHEYLNIEYEQGHSMLVKVTDIAGKFILEQRLPAASGQYRLDCTRLDLGTYFLQLIDTQSGMSTTAQFVKWIH